MKSVRTLLLLTVTVGFLIAGATAADALGVFAQWQDSKVNDSGLGLGLKHKFQIVPIFAAEARASWLRYDGSERWGGFDMFPLEAVARAKLSYLYGGGGVGYYLFSGDDFPPDNSFGAFVMGGGEITLLRLGVFAELRYLFLEPGGDFGRDLSGWGANVGVILPF